MIKLTRNNIAELRGCIPGTVSNAKLPKDAKKLYDLSDPEVWQYVTAPTIERAIETYKRTLMAMDEENGSSDLDVIEQKEKIKKLEKHNREADLKHEIKKQNLVSSELIGIYLGFIASGISNNFLTIGNKIARGDTKLKDRIDKMISTAIKKTLSSAEKELRKESEQIIKYMEGE